MGARGRLTLKTFLEEDQPQYAIITISRFGSRNLEQVLGKIFERFFTTKGQQGTGLGLAVSKEMIESNGGRIEVTSETQGPRHGTTFRLLLPLSTPRANPTEVGEKSGRRILIVDDEPNVREILEDLLSAEGHETLSCESGEKARKLLRENSVDLVFTDLTLPQMDGYRLASAIKKTWAQLPVCLITGWDNPLVTKEEADGQVDRLVNKPFRMEEVLRAVRELTG